MKIDLSPPDAPDSGIAAGHATRLLLAEYIHRTANDFAVACAEVYLAGQEPSLPRTRHRLSNAAERLCSLARIQRILQPPETPMIDLGDALGALCHHHALARFAEQGVFVQLRAGEVVIDSARGWALLMIVSELLTNAARHAFDAPGGIVRVDIGEDQGDVICLVSDDGIGMQRHRARPGTGTRIIAEIAREAGIGLNAQACRAGTRHEIRLPLRAARGTA